MDLPVFVLVCFSYTRFNDVICLGCICLAGTQLATVGGVPREILRASIPADCRICLGLVGRPLLDIPLHCGQRHAALCAGGLRSVEALDNSQDQVHAKEELADDLSCSFVLSHSQRNAFSVTGHKQLVVHKSLMAQK